MTRNIGSIKRVLRELAGLVPFATAAIGWCFPSAPLGANTCRRPTE